jgi:hypothetical protein
MILTFFIQSRLQPTLPAPDSRENRSEKFRILAGKERPAEALTDSILALQNLGFVESGK